MSEWEARKIKDLPIGIIDGDRSARYPKQDELVKQGILFLNTTNIINDRLDLSDAVYINQEKFDSLSKGKLQLNDIIMTTRGSVGKVALFNVGHATGFINAQMLIIRADQSKIDPYFLYYLLRSESVQNSFNNYSSGSAQPQLPIRDLKEIVVHTPPLPTQRRIAAILSAYDDLIENNSRRIKALEQAAHDLYREWFVEFRFPGHESVEMVDSGTGYGMIPQGWEVVKLEEVADVNAFSIRNGDIPAEIEYVDISSVSTGRIDGTQIIPFEDAPGRARRIVRHGDTIWATVRPNRRSYALILRPSENLIVSTGFAVITPSKIPYSYLYKSLTTDAFADYLTNHATGSAYPAVNANDFKSADILVPSADIAEAFHSIVADFYAEKTILERKNNALREARDLLLPRLVSGQVGVDDVEIGELDAN